MARRRFPYIPGELQFITSRRNADLDPEGHCYPLLCAVAFAVIASCIVLTASAQQGRAMGAGGHAAMRSEKRTGKTITLGSLWMTIASGPRSNQWSSYLVEVLDHHGPTWKYKPNVELRIIDQKNRVIFVDRGDQPLLYMFPLIPMGNLLATVWQTGDSLGHVKVYQLIGNSARVVFDNGSQFNPQLIESNESSPNPFVLLDRSNETGSIARPTKTEIWEWVPAAGRFILRATVPVAKKFTALAKLQSQAKRK